MLEWDAPVTHVRPHQGWRERAQPTTFQAAGQRSRRGAISMCIIWLMVSDSVAGSDLLISTIRSLAGRQVGVPERLRQVQRRLAWLSSVRFFEFCKACSPQQSQDWYTANMVSVSGTRRTWCASQRSRRWPPLLGGWQPPDRSEAKPASSGWEGDCKKCNQLHSIDSCFGTTSSNQQSQGLLGQEPPFQ